MKAAPRDKPLYVALFTEGAFQNWIDRSAGDYLHHLIGQGAESRIINAAAGLGHRLNEGHDLKGFLEVVEEGGLEEVAPWFQHMFADVMSPDGIPLPGASYVYRFLEDTIGVRERFFIDWTCASASDLISAGLVLLILARVHKLATEGQRIQRLASLTVG